MITRMANRGAGASAAAPPRANVGDLERWVSGLAGGTLVGLGLIRRSPGGLTLAAAGGSLVYRGVTGHCPVYGALHVNTTGEAGAVRIRKSMTINRPAADLYNFWRDFTNLPRVMKHLESVLPLGENRSHWIVKGPMGSRVEWDAEITEMRENEEIAWRSLPGSSVQHHGSVRFRPATGGRGTEVTVNLEYSAPSGGLGALLARFTGEEPAQQVREDLRRFKAVMEAGEVATTEGQPHG